MFRFNHTFGELGTDIVVFPLIKYCFDLNGGLEVCREWFDHECVFEMKKIFCLGIVGNKCNVAIVEEELSV